MTLGEKIRELRIANDTTQRELADALGVDHSYISKIERGKAFPSRQLIVNAARVFGVSVDGLTGGAQVAITNDRTVVLRIWPNSTIYRLTATEAETLRDAINAVILQPCHCGEPVIRLTGVYCERHSQLNVRALMSPNCGEDAMGRLAGMADHAACAARRGK